MQDYGKYWFTSAINGVLGYAGGLQGGQALRLAWNLTGLQVFGNYSAANTVPADTTNFVMGCQAQWNLDNVNPNAGYNKFVGVNWGGVDYQLQLNGQGWMRL